MRRKSSAPTKAAISGFSSRGERFSFVAFSDGKPDSTFPENALTGSKRVKVESISYSVSGLPCRGELIYDDHVTTRRPLSLMAPNWRGVTEPAIEIGQMLAADRYIVLVADMFGEGRGPQGHENPMDFLRPLMAEPAEVRRRISAALETLTQEAARRAIGDVTRRAAIGYCFGGSNVIDLARAGADVQAVVSMHGVLATGQPARRGDVKAAVLAVHGAADPVSPKAHRDAFEAEMDAAGARWELFVFGGVVHSFTDPSADRPGASMYNERAMRQGYAVAHAFIADAFAGRV
jgi:dienelactone hydrolase